MVKKVFLYILPILVFVSLQGISQEIIRKSYYFEKNLIYDSFDANSNGSHLIAKIASNNVTNLYWVSINVQASLMLQLNTAEAGQLSANIILQDYALDGETNFRDFEIDTLLMPDIIEGNVNIYYKDKLIISQPWLLAVRTGHVRLFVPDTVQFNEKKLRVELELNRFDYSNEKFNIFNEKTNLINAYYAFTQVLADMLETYAEPGLNSNQNPSYILIAWEEIQRVNNYVYRYNFFNQLNLDVYDPDDFISNYDKSIRLQRRATTLKSWINRSSVDAIIDDKEAFCAGFAGLSKKYIDLSGQHQPYIATGFSEVARIITSDQVKDMLTEAAKFYDVFNNIEGAGTQQLIYNEFLDLANITIANQRYVATLDLLYNASLMTEWFESVNKSVAYNTIYETAIDGLMSAYLKVATMAYRSETFYMAEVYYQKAMDVYELHSDHIRGKKLASDAFLDFIEQQTELSYKMIEDKEYFQAISLLNKAKWISEEQQLTLDQAKIDSAFRLSYSGIYDIKLDSIQLLLTSHHPEAALDAMEKTNAFAKEKHQYLQDVNELHFEVLAQALFDTYYELGDTQMRTNNPEKAMYAYLKARSINDKYMNERHKKLDSLINNATVPVIDNLVEKAEFHVWANRIQEAQLLLVEAKGIQTKYQQENNVEINNAIVGLETKIKSRYCINFSNECFSIEKKAENRLTAKKYEKAHELLLQAEEIIQNNPTCEIKDEKITSLLVKYDDVFKYYELGKQISNNLSNRNYKEAIQGFAELDERYVTKNIKRFGIGKTDVFGIVKGRMNKGLSYAAAEYYVQAGNFETAFRYLELLKQQGADAKETRNLQYDIGKGLAGNEALADNNKNLADVVNGSDKWYRYLKKSF